MRIIMPEAVAVGDTVTLTCDFNLEGDPLYSIRWYFEVEEFYRYVPKEAPPMLTFPVSETTVDVTKSGERKVTLSAVNRNQSGRYQCEVSADAPSFHTDVQSAVLQVVELPESEPVLSIRGMQPAIDYKRTVTIGETFTATCVSGPSHPPVNFTWFLNGNQQPSTNSGLRDMGAGQSWESREAWSELNVNVDNRLITNINHKLVVRCDTNIYNLYRGAGEAELHVIDESMWANGGKVSPTTDQRSGATNTNGGSGNSGGAANDRGDPDNSALTGSASRIHFSTILSCMCIVQFVFSWKLIKFLS